MSTIPVNKGNAIKAFRNADQVGKKLLSDLLGEEHFNQKITELVKSSADALALAPEQPEELKMLLNYKGTNKDVLAVAAFVKLMLGIRVLNEGGNRDYNNSSQVKYEPSFNLSSAGSGFSCHGYGHWYSYSYAGSRLAYLDKNLMFHGVEIFQHEYKALYTE